MKIENAHCLITGATEGIGRAVAFALGHAGARLTICSRTAARVAEIQAELQEAGIQAVGAVCDVSREEEVGRLIEQAHAAFGAVDVLVNNAGIGSFTPVAETSAEDFDRVMQVNVRGVFLMSRAVLEDMRDRGGGHIVNIASLAGRNPVPGGAAYAASKHAVIGFSKSLFAEVRKSGIRVTAICPGSVVTPFFEKSGASLDSPERKLQPQDVAATVLAVLQLPHRALISELDIRPTNP